MFENYRYFLVIAEELNITRAAERLFVTHQCLSRYLSKLEEECGVTLFYRKPVFSITPEGKEMLDSLRRVELLENNLKTRFEEELKGDAGELWFGTTEGRFRILMPNLISRFESEFPKVQLHVSSANSVDLRQMLMDNRLDIILTGRADKSFIMLENHLVMQEKLYVVISDGMMQKHFGDQWKKKKKEYRKEGTDLTECTEIPFCFNMPGYNSSKILERHLNHLGISLNCVHTSSHPDLHHILTTRDYAASLCLTMYIPNLYRINENCDNPLNIFPIRGLEETNPVTICHVKNRTFPRYGRALINILREQCADYSTYDLV